MNTTTPSREDVARRAEEIWKAEGCPSGRDTEFWFEAERQLSQANSTTPSESGNAATPSPAGNAGDRGNGNSQVSPAGGPSRAPDPKAPQESQSKEPVIPPVQPTEKAPQQKKSARAPKSPTKTPSKSGPR